MGDWHYIKATATITDGERSISVKAFAREQPTKKKVDDSQLTGSASFVRVNTRLMDCSLLMIKDADTDEYQKQQQHVHHNKHQRIYSQQRATSRQTIRSGRQ